jgi:cation diffusion facilitator family transporter
MAGTPRHLKNETDATQHGHGRGALAFALLVSVATTAGALVASDVTGSAAMVAVAGLAVAAVGSHALVLLSSRRAARAAVDDHPFGYGRAHHFWAFATSLLLVGVAALVAAWVGIDALDDPQPLEQPEIALAVGGVAILLGAVALRVAGRAADRVRGDAPWRPFLRRAKSPELPVVLVWDVGTLAGLVIATGGVAGAMATDDGAWDAYATLAIGALLGVIALLLVVAMKSLLIGESANRKDVEAIRGAIEVDPDVIGLIHIRTEHLGPEELLVGAKVEFQHELTVAEVAGAIDRVERAIRAGVPAARVIYLEPDVHHEHRVATFVEERVGHIDRDDPDYAEITGLVPDDDIWT